MSNIIGSTPNYRTFFLLGGDQLPPRIRDLGLAIIKTEKGLFGTKLQHLECGCIVEWYPHSLRSVDYCLLHAGYISVDDLEFTSSPGDGANICDWFRHVGEDSPYEFDIPLPVWEYLGPDASGIGVKYAVKGRRYLVIQ